MIDQTKTLYKMHDHLMGCRLCPDSMKEDLFILFAKHEEEKKTKNLGTQVVFYGRIWDRLHKKHKKQQSNWK
jgi:hypothetical protein